MYAYLCQQAESLRSVIAALHAAQMDATTYEKALVCVEQMIAEEVT